MNTIGLILAGGRARRMGGVEKAFIPLNGRALIEHVAERVAPQVTELLVNMSENLRPLSLRYEILPDLIGGFLGPLAGILSGLEWMKENRPDARWLATFPCDTPFLPGDCVARLIERAESMGALVACAASKERRHNVCAVWSAKITETAHSVLNERGLRKMDDFLAILPYTEEDFEGDPIDPFFNVNTPGDLKTAEEIARQALG
jgi:molybdenum cofactor guanylyltransferase